MLLSMLLSMFMYDTNANSNIVITGLKYDKKHRRLRLSVFLNHVCSESCLGSFVPLKITLETSYETFKFGNFLSLGIGNFLSLGVSTAWSMEGEEES